MATVINVAKGTVVLTSVNESCSPSSDDDSRGAGWYCHRNRWNPRDRKTCVCCGHERCDVVAAGRGRTVAVVTSSWTETVRAARAAGFALPKGPGARSALAAFCRSAGIPVPGDQVKDGGGAR